MKIDYNKLMHKEISSFGEKPKLLLHCCCAPCSSAVIEKLKNYFEITYFYYNPNIFPQEEYELRKDEFLKLGVNVVELKYNHADFLNVVSGLENEKEGGARCRFASSNRMVPGRPVMLKIIFAVILCFFQSLGTVNSK